jgi:hypothetical protein
MEKASTLTKSGHYIANYNIERKKCTRKEGFINAGKSIKNRTYGVDINLKKCDTMGGIENRSGFNQYCSCIDWRQ